jgi:hypothetical protein
VADMEVEVSTKEREPRFGSDGQVAPKQVGKEGGRQLCSSGHGNMLP